MMDLKEIIRWFIPCFHILLKIKLSRKFVIVCLCLFLNLVESSTISSEILSVSLEKKLNDTKIVDVSSANYGRNEVISQSEDVSRRNLQGDKIKGSKDASIVSGRTFGRPFKKMMAGLLPVIFQMGAASTWAVVAALVGVKTLLVSLAILKLLLIAGAAKVGALFGSKSQSQHHESAPHQKEIHLHIHNSGHEHQEEHYPVWSREGYSEEPYKAGPQTISTPFGNYIRVDSSVPTY